MATAFDPDRVPEALIRKIGSLPRDRVAEVEDFVDFLGQRENEIALRHAVSAASSPALVRIWSNPEDDAYDAL
jgi:hypothetical protein